VRLVGDREVGLNGIVLGVQLYIAAYDVRHPRRLSRMLRILKEYSTGGQKSLFECFLRPSDRIELIDRVANELDAEEDSFILLRLDPRMEPKVMGTAVPPVWPEFFVVS
jgi:CRISPR-associated protein Cas2